MQTAADLAPAPAVFRAKASSFSLAGMAFVLGGFWLEFVHHLQGEWSMNPQYSYGWCVPVLAGYLLWKRWLVRPEPDLTASRALAVTLLALSVVLLFPVRFIAEANPDWRLISWSLGLLVVVASLSVSYFAGGRVWVSYFAFPILFLLVAVPWPAQLEQTIVQGLMRLVTSINVIALNLLGTLAVQHGNIIEVATGPIGIEEACSGIRSLQATFMISLFLGDFYDFSLARRVTLVVLGAVLAFLCNLIRTAILVWVGARHGAAAIGNWHDPAGWIILVACLFGLWLVSLALQPRQANQTVRPAPTSTLGFRNFPLMLAVAVVTCLGVTEIAVHFWYRTDELAKGKPWTVQWPKSEPGYEQVEVAPEAEGMLRYNEGGGGVWNDAAGHRWNIYFFRWLPGQTAALFVRNHRPDICLPASGMTMRADEGIALVPVNGFQLPIYSYRFENNGEPLHVYYCYWDGRTTYSAADLDEDWTPSGRLKKVLQRKRDSGTQMLELAVWGFTDDAAAHAALLRELARIVQAG